MRFTDPSGAVLEFQGEGNNLGSVALPINLATPPDLQVSQVSAPTSVLAGQTFTVSYRVVNQGEIPQRSDRLERPRPPPGPLP